MMVNRDGQNNRSTRTRTGRVVARTRRVDTRTYPYLIVNETNKKNECSYSYLNEGYYIIPTNISSQSTS